MEKRKKARDNKPPGTYTLTRFNATRHGILSKFTPLHCESQEEYEKLHFSLRQEHDPAGPTEEHLVEEIAGIFWRKRRLRMAETAAFQSKMHTSRSATDDPEELDDFVKWDFPNVADPFFGSHFEMSPEEWALGLKKPVLDKEYTQKALELLDTYGSERFQPILETMPPRFRHHWKKLVAKGEYSSNPEDFRNYLIKANNIAKEFINFIYKTSSKMAQAHGMIFDTELLDKLSRYEVFLDRKMERILSMLLKLQAIRRGREKVE